MLIRERFFEDFGVGEQRATMGRTVTEADVVIHAGQTGDFYPHHMDAVWAATQPFERRIAHGTLVMAMAVGMTAGDVNPRAMSYGYDRVRFIRPVFIDDTITVTATIAGTRPHAKEADRYGYVDEEVSVVNQDGVTVMALVHVYLVERRSPARQPG